MKRVLIFCAGNCGIQYISEHEQLINSGEMEIIGFVDNDKALEGRLVFSKYDCYAPERIRSLAPDSIVIANASDSVRKEIAGQLERIGVCAGEGVEFYPDFPDLPPDLPATERHSDPRVVFFRDFARFAQEQHIPGNVAECGVNEGNSAKYINRYFRDKTLYLFDTFQGFAPQDVDAEKALGDGEFLRGMYNFVGRGHWVNSSVDLVMSRMTFPKNVVIKEGWVPETFEGIDDTFCFVNLDMDLYQPMLAATRFFWDRMNEGGVMLLHDYYVTGLPGVRKAVDDFEAGLGRRVAKVPCCDSIAIIKG